MTYLTRKLVFVAACLVIAGRSDGSAGFCFEPHGHTPHEHIHRDSTVESVVSAAGIDGQCSATECSCQKSADKRKDCVRMSALPDRIELKQVALAPAPAVNAAGSDHNPEVSCQLYRLGATSNQILSSLRTVILIA